MSFISEVMILDILSAACSSVTKYMQTHIVKINTSLLSLVWSENNIPFNEDRLLKISIFIGVLMREIFHMYY